MSWSASIDQLQRRVSAGDPVANVDLALEYVSGARIPRNIEMAERLLESASRRGLRSATRELAKLYLQTGRKADGYELLFQAAQQSDPEAEFLYGRYQLHLPRQSDRMPTSVLRLLERASDHGSADAMYLLYQVHRDGQGVPSDASLANYWLVRAARAGNADALKTLGQRVFDADPEAAIENLRSQAESGEVTAMLQLATLYHDGKYVSKDLQQSLSWLENAAESGSSAAAYQLGLMYSDQESQFADDDKAFQYMLIAAQAGIPAAKSILGQLYVTGRGTESDPITGLAWILASEADDAGPGISADLNRNLRFAVEDYIDDDESLDRLSEMANAFRSLSKDDHEAE